LAGKKVAAADAAVKIISNFNLKTGNSEPTTENSKAYV
jgi:hypothetical protein